MVKATVAVEKTGEVGIRIMVWDAVMVGGMVGTVVRTSVAVTVRILKMSTLTTDLGILRILTFSHGVREFQQGHLS